MNYGMGGFRGVSAKAQQRTDDVALVGTTILRPRHRPANLPGRAVNLCAT